MKNAKMRTTIEHRSVAVRTVGENKGECAMAMALIYLPRLIFAAECTIILALFLAERMTLGWVTFGVAVAASLQPLLGALFAVPGELMLADLSTGKSSLEVYSESSSSDMRTIRNTAAFPGRGGAFARVRLKCKELGFSRLYRIRLALILSLIRTLAVTQAPAAILIAAFSAAALYGHMPVFAAATLAAAAVAVAFCALLQALAEYDKYSFAYIVLWNSPQMLPSDLVSVSINSAEGCLSEIRRCRRFFFVYNTVVYKRLSIYNIYNVIFEQKETDFKREYAEEFNTVIFDVVSITERA